MWDLLHAGAFALWRAGTGCGLAIFRRVGFKAYFGVRLVRTVSTWRHMFHREEVELALCKS
jgi:hypothetical protein